MDRRRPTSSIEAGDAADPRAAFEVLLRRHLPLVRAAVGARLNPSLIPDAVAETFYRAWRDRHKLDGVGKPGNWLYGIAMRVCMETRRAESRTVSTDPTTLTAVAAAPATTSMDTGPLGDVIAALDEPLREVIHLKYVGQQSYRQMALTLGISVATVGERLTRARQVLRTKLSRLEDEQ